MFSYLRSHHKRTGSNPTSPDMPLPSPGVTIDSAPLPSPGFPEHHHHQPWQREEHAPYTEWQEQEPESEAVSFTPVSPLPPVLPPIPRVASVRKGAKSPTKRESFGINFDRTDLSLGGGISEYRQDSPVTNETDVGVKQTTWSYGQSAFPVVATEANQPQPPRSSGGLSVDSMQKPSSMMSKASKASTNSQTSSARSQKYDGHTSFANGISRPAHRLEGGVSMVGGASRHEHLQFQEQQARLFQRMERPQANRRPHTAGAPTGMRRRPEPDTHQPYSPVTYHGLQPPVPGIAQPMAATFEDVPPTPPLADQASFRTAAPISPRPTVPTMSPGFVSVAYDSARSRTPPQKHSAPGRPGSPVQLPQIKSKSKLNLRNPMSLLLRRRSGHNLESLQLPDGGLLLSINSRSELPDDYDPRIKGTKVHDFNAPRPPPKRVFTSPSAGQGLAREESNPSKGSPEERVDSPRPKRAHTPTAFMEHFDDDDLPANDQGVRAEELANKDFVKRNSRELLGPDSSLPLPPFARRQPHSPSEVGQASIPLLVQPDEEDGSAAAVTSANSTPVSLPPAALTPPPHDSGSIMPTPEDKMRIALAHSPSGMPPQLSPPKPRNRKSLGLPKHLDSRSSRFSFQLGGPEAQLQEKILEERHKAKEAEKAMQAKMTEEDDYSEDDYDNGYDEADLYGEEPIPGMDDHDPMDGPLSSFTLGPQVPSMATYNSDVPPAGVYATAAQLPSSMEPPKLEEQNPLGTVDVVAAARMALSSNPPSPATYSPNSLDARSIRLPSNASVRPSVDRGRTSHEGSLRARFEGSHSGSHSRTREVLSPTTEHPEGLSALICEEDEENDPYDTTALVTEDLGDDMYFDDGMIEDPGDEEDVIHFNEEAFDDPSSRLYERKPVNEPVPGQQRFVTAASLPVNSNTHSHHPSAEQAGESKRVISMESDARPFSGVSSQNYRNSMRKSHLSDFNNLEAYHNALAQAATQAAADGRFMRKPSQTSEGNDDDARFTRYSESSMDSEPPVRHATLDSSGQSLVHHDQRTSNASSFEQRPSGDNMKLDGFPITDGTYPVNLGAHPSIGSGLGFDPSQFNFGEDNGFDGYGDDDDDPIIAAANAEALANDDEGEYGREFGFYAAPPPLATMIQTHFRGGDSSSISGSEDGSEVEYINGGYFGPKGVNTVERSKSLREPNLTPITERSEFSTRNSCISLFGLHSSGGPGLGPASAGPLPSPGLAQLARMSPYSSEHDEMSMENLMKLRRGAFGDGRRGSTSDLSNAGSSSPRNSSPVTQSGGYMLPRHSQLQHSSHAAAVGWLNGVGVGLPSAEGLERLGEDDESSSEEGDSDGSIGDTTADDRIYDDHDSPIPDSPTITASDHQSMSSSPIETQAPDFSSTYRQRNAASHNLTLNTTSPSPSSPLPQPMIFAPATPRSALSAASASSPLHARTPITAHRASAGTASHPPPSPSRVSRPQTATGSIMTKDQQQPQLSGRPSMPHSPAHSRNSSRNEEGVSVAYVMEKDEQTGGQRWVLERRMISEAGEVVVVGREVVTGGRI